MILFHSNSRELIRLGGFSGLIWTAFFSFLVLSCTSKIRPVQGESVERVPFVRIFPLDSTTIYKTGVNVYGHYISGLLLIKPMGEDDYRVVFTTETGLTLFDFGFEGEKFIVHSVIGKMNKKPVLLVLNQDLSAILGRILKGKKAIRSKSDRDSSEVYVLLGKKESHRVSLDRVTGLVLEINTLAPSGKEKRIISFEREADRVPSQIFLAHRNINLNMKLNLLKR